MKNELFEIVDMENSFLRYESVFLNRPWRIQLQIFNYCNCWKHFSWANTQFLGEFFLKYFQRAWEEEEVVKFNLNLILHDAVNHLQVLENKLKRLQNSKFSRNMNFPAYFSTS